MIPMPRHARPCAGQQAKSSELRAATSMARLWRDQGESDEARDLLAKALLDELNA